MEFKKFNCFFVNFLRYNFGLIKFISTVIEREYTPDYGTRRNPTDLLSISVDWFLYDKRLY